MKKLINGVDNVVDEMLNGMTAAFPEYIERVPGTDVVARTGAKKTDKVVLISGGGSGHEPAHGGYVGKGMLDAAVLQAQSSLLPRPTRSMRPSRRQSAARAPS